MKKLRQLRKMAGLTQHDLSRRAGIDRTKLSFAENDYLELTATEQATIMNIIVTATEANAANVRRAANLAEDKALTPASA